MSNEPTDPRPTDLVAKPDKDGRLNLMVPIPRRRGGKGKTPLEMLVNRMVMTSEVDCWLWAGPKNRYGYGVVGVGSGENKAHRLSWRLFRGDIPTGMKVCHKCDVRLCVNPDHLFLATQRENVADMIVKGRRHKHGAKGERNFNAVLTADDVRRLRELRKTSGNSYRSLATMFGITTMTAYRACSGESWSHL